MVDRREIRLSHITEGAGKTEKAHKGGGQRARGGLLIGNRPQRPPGVEVELGRVWRQPGEWRAGPGEGFPGRRVGT